MKSPFTLFLSVSLLLLASCSHFDRGNSVSVSEKSFSAKKGDGGIKSIFPETRKTETQLFLSKNIVAVAAQVKIAVDKKVPALFIKEKRFPAKNLKVKFAFPNHPPGNHRGNENHLFLLFLALGIIAVIAGGYLLVDGIILASAGLIIFGIIIFLNGVRLVLRMIDVTKPNREAKQRRKYIDQQTPAGNTGN